jgi:hypothetical protein
LKSTKKKIFKPDMTHSERKKIPDYIGYEQLIVQLQIQFIRGEKYEGTRYKFVFGIKY